MGIINFNKYNLKGIDFASKSSNSKLPSFAGLNIAPAPLYYGANGFEIKDEDWNHDSYNVAYGKTEGSYYFNIENLGQYFDSSGSSWDGSRDIDNTNKISYKGYDDWRIPTYNELLSWSDTSRSGSTINNISNCCYAMIRLVNVTHAGSTTPYGLLLFPDNVSITATRTFDVNCNGTNNNGNVTSEQLSEYLTQGCIFIPASGINYSHSFYYSGTMFMQWSSTIKPSDSSRFYDIISNSFNLTNNDASLKTQICSEVRLVRNVN